MPPASMQLWAKITELLNLKSGKPKILPQLTPNYLLLPFVITLYVDIFKIRQTIDSFFLLN